MMRKVPHPTLGEKRLHEFLEPMGISAYRSAKIIGVPQYPDGRTSRRA